MIIDAGALALLPFEVQAEIAENLFRKDLLPSEIDAVRQRCETILREQARLRQAAAGPVEGRGAKPIGAGKFPQAVGMGRIRDQIGALAGISGRTVDKIAQVCEAARAEPERFAGLVADMDRTGKVDTVFKLLKTARAREAYEARKVSGGTVADLAALAASGYRAGVILADPPWPFETWSDRGKVQTGCDNHYDTLSLDDIQRLPVVPLAADDCVLFLWSTWPCLMAAGAVIEAWGFTYKTCGFNWLKTNPGGEGLHWGNGYWTRANSEVCLLATRGNPSRLATDIHQVVMEPVSLHSAKPEEVAQRIERLVAGPYLELFARRERPGWTVWGDEVPVAFVDNGGGR